MICDHLIYWSGHLEHKYLLFLSALTRFWRYWRDGRVVDCGGLENRCSPSGEPGVRIPLSPQRQITPADFCGIFIFIWPNQACLSEDI